ncbi:phosphatase PAP2 family protein [Curtobacterium sp. ISL-83]|uniref:phosphatase PAP2 family protein n=1 Tax=Curtobacterium sp. ISL-83 TaxID=2819145 RepID=UPI001BE95B95|nr:phosphatase PAP2 family protein [Curtobacterium sp. ISL-83]MBT2502218.1 phosphatase PAP2 family protein [Curtobacterium sp. ISL-83]
MGMGGRAVVADEQSTEPVTGRRWLVIAAASAVVVVVTYLVAVWTVGGQTLENAALRGADQVTNDDLDTANRALNAITISSLAVAVVLVAAVALLRRRIDLAIAGVGVIVLGQVITQTLKRFALPRPPLVHVVGDYSQNSFPSGHTTIAMTVLFAAIIVIPHRWRGITLLVVLTWATGIGAYTVTAKWHRFSDTLGGDAIALLCASLAAWWLSRRGAVGVVTGPRRRGRLVLVAVVVASTVLLLVLGVILWGVPLARGTDLAHADPAQDSTAYLGAHALAAACSGVAALVFWWSWRGREVTARR